MKVDKSYWGYEAEIFKYSDYESFFRTPDTSNYTVIVLDSSDDALSPDAEDKLVIDNNNLVLTDNTLVIEKKPLSVYFRNDVETYIKNFDKDWAKDSMWEPRLCSNWDELSACLKEEPHQLIFHIDMVTNVGVTIHEFVQMIDTLIKLVCPNKTIPVAVGIESTTHMNVIKELQKSNIHGIIPSALTFGLNETMQGIDALFNRIPYWPKHILQQLPGAIKTVTKNTITLTARQSEIADLISSRGLSNKRIANALGITESTVKIHVSAILKAYGVRTRTQLAVVANK